MNKYLKYIFGILMGVMFLNSTVEASGYTVTDTNCILYSNADSALYIDADLNSTIVLTKEEFPDNVPIQVTGITSTGFYRIYLEGTYYIPGYGLQNNIETTATSDEVSKRPTPIDIVGYRIGVNSVGGIPVYIYLQNTSGKTINSIDFTVTPYNAVGKKQKCSIRGYSTHVCTLNGPIYSSEVGTDIYTGEGKTSSIFYRGTDRAFYISGNRQVKFTDKDIPRTFTRLAMWDCVWYNGSIETITIDKIKVKFADGTSEIVAPSDVITMFD